MSPKLDLSKLAAVRPAPGGGHSAACPACRAAGHDKTGNHLRIYRDSSFSCAAFPKDRAHSADILKLVGMGSDGTAALSLSTEVHEEAETQSQLDLKQTWDASVLDYLTRDHSYWATRGINEETVAPFRGGVSTSNELRGRYVFPIFNSIGQVVGFTGRALESWMKPKWLHKGLTRHWVWGGLPEIVATKRVILVESIGDSLALRQTGIPESLVLFGVSISQSVIGHLIAANPRQIIISTNRDSHGVGQKAAAKAQILLEPFFNSETICVRLPPEGVKDWNEASPEQIRTTFQP